jgi:DNA ligase (NAD+)
LSDLLLIYHPENDCVFEDVAEAVNGDPLLVDVTGLPEFRKRFLEEAIATHDKLYWEKNAQAISDDAYDALVKELRDLDPENDLVNKVHSPTPAVGAPFKFDLPMLSLNKAYSVAEAKTWAAGVCRTADELCNVGPKFDGWAVEVGEDYMATNGDDGIVGALITHKMSLVDFSRKTLPIERGELVVFKSDLHKLKNASGKKYKTCRSALSGVLGSDYSSPEWTGLVRFMPHSTVIGTATLAELEAIDWEATMLDEQAADYPVDGLVIALADKEYGESLGATSHHPRHSVAFKCKNPTGVTKVEDIVWQVGKHKITPVAILRPVTISGCEHSRALLHNIHQIERLGLCPGAKVEVARCGDVIPQIVGVVAPGPTPVTIPDRCPACDAPTEIVNDGQDLKCTNPHCGGVAAKKLRDALVRLEIDECGPAVCSSLVALGKLTPGAILRMSQEDWLKVDGYAEVSATKAHSRVLQRLRTPIDDFRVLAAMNFEGIGLTNARKIMDVYNARDLTAGADLAAVEGIGEVRAKAIDLGIEWVDLLGLLQVVESKGQLSRPQVCFTGADARPREEWIKIAEERGYVFNKTVTKKTTVLVLADVNSTSTKAKKARQYGTVKLMTYEEFENVH